MAKVVVDANLCVGCGLCEQQCPEVFKVEADGIAHVIGQTCASCKVEEVVPQCPVEAIKLQ
ncbi:MAG: ferredoxin [Candidatus Omnitrophica bacterium]|nr:ferredoxin [Candidatus Omnitrophota bacterium]MDD5236875.1 ferredoxin [Candidatus Omnitrophota bacterium]MDD5610283.1 ferredoxin [Candidatus Omnitrophota bacterium]